MQSRCKILLCRRKGGRALKILIFTDSHGYNVSMACAVEREAPDMVLHLGDHTDDARELENVFPRLTVCAVRCV